MASNNTTALLPCPTANTILGPIDITGLIASLVVSGIVGIVIALLVLIFCAKHFKWMCHHASADAGVEAVREEDSSCVTCVWRKNKVESGDDDDIFKRLIFRDSKPTDSPKKAQESPKLEPGPVLWNVTQRTFAEALILNRPESETILFDHDINETRKLLFDLATIQLATFSGIARSQLRKFLTDRQFDPTRRAAMEREIDLQLMRARFDEAVNAEFQSVKATLQKKKEANAEEMAATDVTLALNRILLGLMEEKAANLRKQLEPSQTLSSDDIDDIFRRLTDDVEVLKTSIAKQMNDQLVALEERLSRRQRLLAACKEKSQLQIRQLADRVDLAEQAIKNAGKVPERERAEILRRYEESLKKILEVNNKSLITQQASLADRLRAKRQQNLDALDRKVADETSASLSTRDATSEIARRCTSRGQLIERLDQQEYQEMIREIEKATQTLEAELETADQRLFTEISQFNPVNISEAMQRYRREAEARKRKQETESQVQLRRLQEELSRRLEAKLAERKEAMTNTETSLQARQDWILRKALTLQKEMPEETQKLILQQKTAQVTALATQLELSRQLQEKQLERRLAEQRAKIATTQQQRDLLPLQRHLRERDKVALEASLKKMDSEQAKLNNDHKKRMDDLRQRLAVETKQALERQRDEISKLLGQLKVEEALREAVAERNERYFQNLGEKLIRQQGRESSKENTLILDQYLQSYQNQRTLQNDKLESSKKEQIRRHDEKIQAKQAEKTRLRKRQSSSRPVDGVIVGEVGQLNLQTEMKIERNREEHLDKEEIDMERAKGYEQLDRYFLEQKKESDLEAMEKLCALLAKVKGLTPQQVDTCITTAAQEVGIDPRERQRLADKFHKLKAKTESEFQRLMQGGGYDEVDTQRLRAGTEFGGRRTTPGARRPDSRSRFEEDDEDVPGVRRGREEIRYDNDFEDEDEEEFERTRNSRREPPPDRFSRTRQTPSFRDDSDEDRGRPASRPGSRKGVIAPSPGAARRMGTRSESDEEDFPTTSSYSAATRKSVKGPQDVSSDEEISAYRGGSAHSGRRVAAQESSDEDYDPYPRERQESQSRMGNRKAPQRLRRGVIESDED